MIFKHYYLRHDEIYVFTFSIGLFLFSLCLSTTLRKNGLTGFREIIRVGGTWYKEYTAIFGECSN